MKTRQRFGLMGSFTSNYHDPLYISTVGASESSLETNPSPVSKFILDNREEVFVAIVSATLGEIRRVLVLHCAYDVYFSLRRKRRVWWKDGYKKQGHFRCKWHSMKVMKASYQLGTMKTVGAEEFTIRSASGTDSILIAYRHNGR